MSRTKYDHKTLQEIFIRRIKELCREIAQDYKLQTGETIPPESVLYLIRDRRIGLGVKFAQPYRKVDPQLAEEILMEDPYLAAYPSQFYYKYEARDSHPPIMATVREWLGKNGLKAAMNSPLWDPEIIDTAKRKKLVGYVIPGETE